MSRSLDRVLPTALPAAPLAARAPSAGAYSTSLLAIAFLAWSGCSMKPSGDATPTATPAAPSAETKAAEPTAAAPLKIAFAYVGPVGDAGWTFAHDKARREAEAAFAGKVKTSFVENVPEAADAERVIRDMVAQGNTLIFGTTFGYMTPMLKVAKDAKDVKFEHATGYK